jgi:hypothetical protein
MSLARVAGPEGFAALPRADLEAALATLVTSHFVVIVNAQVTASDQ